MVNIRRRIIVSFLVVLAACTLFVLGVAMGSHAEQGVTVRLMSYPGPDNYAINEQIPLFEKETGIKVKFDFLPWDMMIQKMLTELLRPEGRYDMICSVPSLIFDYAFELEPFDDYFTKETREIWDDIFPVAKAYGFLRGRNYAVPLVANVRLLYYRKDLLAKAGLTVPREWSEFIETAKYFTRPEKNLYGVATPLKRGKPVWEAWLEQFFSFGSEFFDETWHAPINGAAGIKSLEALREMIRYAPPGVLSYAYKESGEAMCKELVALQINWMSRAQMVDDPKISKVVGKVGFSAPPLYDRPKGPVTWDGGDHWILAANSLHKAEAAKFALWTLRKDVLKRITLSCGMAPARISLLRDPELLERWPYIAGAMDPLREGMVNPLFQVYGGTQIYSILAAYLSDALVSDEPTKEILDKMRAEVEEVLKEQKYIE